MAFLKIEKLKNFYDKTIWGKIEKNDFLHIVSIKNRYYLKFYADSNAINPFLISTIIF